MPVQHTERQQTTQRRARRGLPRAGKDSSLPSEDALMTDTISSVRPEREVHVPKIAWWSQHRDQVLKPEAGQHVGIFKINRHNALSRQ